MKIENLLRVLMASHYTAQVECPPKLTTRGGIMLVAPPGSLKTAILKAALKSHVGALGLSDLNVQGLGRLRHSLSTGKITTLMFYEYSKLYKRDADTASNLEGLISALVDESYDKLAFDVLEAHTLPCSALVMGAMVPSFYERRLRDWESGGFARRFIWCMYRLDNPHAISNSIAKWEELAITQGVRFQVPSSTIPYTVTHKEAKQIHHWLKDNHGLETPAVLLQKVASVLRWENQAMQSRDDTMEVLQDFSESLRVHGARLTMTDEMPISAPARKITAVKSKGKGIGTAV